MAEKIAVEMFGHPGKTSNVDRAKYVEMRTHVMSALPDAPPGMKVADLIDQVRPMLSGVLFPGGATCGWWVKCVQLDLEAKGIVQRAATAPVRLWRVQ